MFRLDKMHGKSLPGRFDDWVLKEGKIKMQSICDYKDQ